MNDYMFFAIIHFYTGTETPPITTRNSPVPHRYTQVLRATTPSVPQWLACLSHWSPEWGWLPARGFEEVRWLKCRPHTERLSDTVPTLCLEFESPKNQNQIVSIIIIIMRELESPKIQLVWRNWGARLIMYHILHMHATIALAQPPLKSFLPSIKARTGWTLPLQ